jgi:6-pyruvoyltetrahydropterin/6-carboxytetrahydropterin synthase
MLKSKINRMDFIRITKVFTFDMAHALDGYDGLCKNIHGHTYHLRITLLGEVRNELNHPKNGFVLDFNEIKALVNAGIIHVFDHALVLNKNSELIKKGEIGKFSERIVATAYQPTCENLLMDFKQRIESGLPSKVELVSVRLDETPTSYAEWCRSDQN